MLSTATGKEAPLTDTREGDRKNTNIVVRKIWLPKLLYDALPYFYLVSGIAAFLTTLYISEWFWVLPHYLLFSAACVHFGIFVYRRRHRLQEDA
ncbi:MAG: hypothetical protein QNJ14_05910 [Woeseiaceae bacterium]|nr:hypothetical protein [Woeseiaceae bacterium]